MKNKFIEKIIGLPISKGYMLVQFEEILLCKAEGNHTQVHFRDGEPVVVNRSLKKLEAELPVEFFFRAHHSYLANLMYAKMWLKKEGQLIFSKEGMGIQVARSRRKALERRLNLKKD